MSCKTQKLDSYVYKPLIIECETYTDKKIKDFSLNGSIIFRNGELLSSHLSRDDIEVQKKGLEGIFEKNFSKYRKFRIKNIDDKNIDGRICLESYFSFFRFGNPTKISSDTAKKIFDFCSQIEDIEQNNEIFSKVKTHNIAQLEKKPNTNRKLTALFLGLLTIGFLAAIIGIGSFLPQIGLISPSLGIVGIPFNVSIALMLVGITTLVATIALKITAKKSTVANEYLKDILKMKSQLFIESNLNDFLNCCLHLLLALTFLRFAGVVTLQGCLAYPAGILTIFSAIYQGIESLKTMKNAKQTKDNELFIKAIFGVVFTASLFIFGTLTTIGMGDSFLLTIFMFTTGLLMLSLAGFGMKKAYSVLKELKELNISDTQSIMQFLKNKLTLNINEIEKIKTTVSMMKKNHILDWIKQNKKMWSTEQKEKWEEIYKKLEKKEIEIEEVKKLILREEIKNAIEKKLDAFRRLVKEDTYKKSIDVLRYKDTYYEQTLKKLFVDVKKEITLKTRIEMIKFFVLYLLFMLVPVLNMSGILSSKLYHIAFSAICLLSLSINLTPRFRNVPPAIEKEPLNINASLKQKAKRKMDPEELKTEEEEKVDIVV